MMKKIVYFRIAGKDVHLPKLIGAFVIFAAVLMFIQSSAVMFDSWDAAKDTGKCIQLASANSLREEVGPDLYPKCRELANPLGIYVRDGQDNLTTRQFWGSLLGPVASIMFWLAILFFGLILYRTGELVLPIEQTTVDVQSKPVSKVILKKKK